MTKYLQTDGVDDYLTFDSGNCNRIVLDIVVDGGQAWTGQGGHGYITAGAFNLKSGIDNNGNIFLQGTTQHILVNGIELVNGTPFNNFGERITWEVSTSSNNYTPTIFSYNGGSPPGTFIKGKIYDIKAYDSATGKLNAHYDMTTGTVVDQSGNGKNATLNGGTWLDDGAGATGTPVSYTYDTEQSFRDAVSQSYDAEQRIFANESIDFDTKQSIYKNRVSEYDTKQIFHQTIQKLYDAKQSFFDAVSLAFDTEQKFIAITVVEYQFDTLIKRHKAINQHADTMQIMHQSISVEYDTKQAFFKAVQSLFDAVIEYNENQHLFIFKDTLKIEMALNHVLSFELSHNEKLTIEKIVKHILKV